MSSNITSELVERIAQARVNNQAEHFNSLPESDRANIPDFAFKVWDEQDLASKHSVREYVLNQLNEITPHLIAVGWWPAEKAAEFEAWMKQAPGGAA